MEDTIAGACILNSEQLHAVGQQKQQSQHYFCCCCLFKLSGSELELSPSASGPRSLPSLAVCRTPLRLFEAAFALNRHIVASTSFVQVSAKNASLTTRGPLGHMAPHAPLSLLVNFPFRLSRLFSSCFKFDCRNYQY